MFADDTVTCNDCRELLEVCSGEELKIVCVTERGAGVTLKLQGSEDESKREQKVQGGWSLVSVVLFDIFILC